jgi:hypothetical protein
MSPSPPTRSADIDIYNALLCLGIAADLLCAISLLPGRVYRRLPFLSIYLLYSALADMLGVSIYFSGRLGWYWGYLPWASAIGYGLDFALAFNIARTLAISTQGAARIKKHGPTIAASAALAAAALYFVTDVVHYAGRPDMPASYGALAHAELTVVFLRALAFSAVLVVALATGAGRAAWIAQLATYFALYFYVNLISAYMHEYIATGARQYDYFERIEIFRMVAWIALMLLTAKDIRRGPPNIEDGDAIPKGEPR